tara:strand:- start:177 stop:401 length:225 start_codon:yes stop_codon:yes gene_type:complete
MGSGTPKIPGSSNDQKQDINYNNSKKPFHVSMDWRSNAHQEDDLLISDALKRVLASITQTATDRKKDAPAYMNP